MQSGDDNWSCKSKFIKKRKFRYGFVTYNVTVEIPFGNLKDHSMSFSWMKHITNLARCRLLVLFSSATAVTYEQRGAQS